MKYICWETFLKKFSEMGIIAAKRQNVFQNFRQPLKFAEIMDARDETHIIHACYAASWEKY